MISPLSVRKTLKKTRNVTKMKYKFKTRNYKMRQTVSVRGEKAKIVIKEKTEKTAIYIYSNIY